MSVGPWEILLIVVIVVLLFGARRIPELARALGKASREYKKAKDELTAEADELAKDVAQTDAAQTAEKASSAAPSADEKKS